MLIILKSNVFKKLYFKIFKSQTEYSNLKSSILLSQKQDSFNKIIKEIEKFQNCFPKKRAKFSSLRSLWRFNIFFGDYQKFQKPINVIFMLV